MPGTPVSSPPMSLESHGTREHPGPSVDGRRKRSSRRQASAQDQAGNQVPPSRLQSIVAIVSCLTAIAAVSVSYLTVRGNSAQVQLTQGDQLQAAISELGAPSAYTQLAGITILRQILHNSPDGQSEVRQPLIEYIQDHDPAPKERRPWTATKRSE